MHATIGQAVRVTHGYRAGYAGTVTDTRDVTLDNFDARPIVRHMVTVLFSDGHAASYRQTDVAQ